MTDDKVFIWDGKSSVPKDVENVKIADGVTEIGESTFGFCENLKEITIPDSVTKIGEKAFMGCDRLKEITIPDSVTEIGEGAFWDCRSLGFIAIPDSVTEIGENTFYGCKRLEIITIPDSVTKIGEHAFWDCRSLENIIIPNSVTKIGDGAFWECESLKEITIPDNVPEIGDFAFMGCVSMERVLYKNHDIKQYLAYNPYGEDSFEITKQLLDNNVNLNMDMFKKAVEAAHAGRLDTFCENHTTDGKTSSYAEKMNKFADDWGNHQKELHSLPRREREKNVREMEFSINSDSDKQFGDD